MANLSISDSINMGEPHLIVSNPAPARVEPPPPLHNTLDLLAAQQDAIVAHIHHLESRIIELESRTWWSMLVDWVCFWK